MNEWMIHGRKGRKQSDVALRVWPRSGLGRGFRSGALQRVTAELAPLATPAPKGSPADFIAANIASISRLPASSKGSSGPRTGPPKYPNRSSEYFSPEIPYFAPSKADGAANNFCNSCARAILPACAESKISQQSSGNAQAKAKIAPQAPFANEGSSVEADPTSNRNRS